MDAREAAGVVRESYGFGEVAIGERLEGGYANDLFRVEADGTPLVLRLKLPPADLEDIAWEHRLCTELAERLPEVDAPLAARDGATWCAIGDRVGWLVPFRDAAPADPGREAHRREAARALGRLHREGAELELPRRPRLQPLRELEWPSLAIPDELGDWRTEIVEARAWAIAFVARLGESRELPAGLVHGDCFPGNVLMAGDEVVALIDWEEAQHDWLVWDLACTINTFCFHGDSLDRTAAARFAAGYRAAGGPSPAGDDELLVPLMRVKRILEVLRAPTDRDPRWEHQRHNLRALIELGP